MYEKVVEMLSERSNRRLTGGLLGGRILKLIPYKFMVRRGWEAGEGKGW